MDGTKVVDVGVEACKDGKFEVKAVAATKLSDGRKTGKKELSRRFFESQRSRAYYSKDGDPLACEKELKEPLRRWVLEVRQQLEESNPEWAHATWLSPRFLKSQSEAARRVAKVNKRNLRSRYLDNPRVVLIGHVTRLIAMCTSARAAAIRAGGLLVEKAGGNFRKGLLTRNSAAALSEAGDAFHFVAAVPIWVLAALVSALKSKRGVWKAKNCMRAWIKRSGVDLHEKFDIWLNGAAFPGGRPEVQRLQDDDVVALNDLTTCKKPYILIGGFYDPADKGGRPNRYEINLPGGKRNLGESGLDCWVRELSEEIPGINIDGAETNPNFGPYHIVVSV